MWPFSIQTARLHMRSTCSVEWLTSSTVTPSSSMRRLMRSSHFCWNRKSPTESVSSTMSRSGSVAVAIEKAMRATMPDE